MSSASRGTQPSTLLDACIDALAGGIEHVERLTGISEELALALFDEVIRRGKLNPRVLSSPSGLILLLCSPPFASALHIETSAAWGRLRLGLMRAQHMLFIADPAEHFVMRKSRHHAQGCISVTTF